MSSACITFEKRKSNGLSRSVVLVRTLLCTETAESKMGKTVARQRNNYLSRSDAGNKQIYFPKKSFAYEEGK